MATWALKNRRGGPYPIGTTPVELLKERHGVRETQKSFKDLQLAVQDGAPVR